MSIKYIFITGGVISSLGKGLAASSIALLLESRGLKIAMLKLDPYINVDPGTMNPFQHGEVYVTDDGSETDLDLGHYFRFSNTPLSAYSNATSGQIYDTVIKKERKGEYLGKTVQVIPHITDEIKRRIHLCSNQEKNIDVVFVEIGGTVGDIESLPFLEAIRQFRNERQKDCINIHLTYVPYIKAAAELKTKPTQHSVQMLREIGILPDIILCRCENTLSSEIKDKIALFCNVKKERVFEAKDVKKSIYEVPLEFTKQAMDEKIAKFLKIKLKSQDLKEWKKMVSTILKPKKTITIGIVGKYIDHQDAYKSIFEALFHAATEHNVELEILKFESDKIDDSNYLKKLAKCEGILVPGGFGERGWEGKILSAKYCREKKKPYFGICLGMHVLCVEFAKNVLKLSDANSIEIDPNTTNPIIDLMKEQKQIENMGGTMRLGAYPCDLKERTKAYKAYGKKFISERHRHRYEFNNKYLKDFEENGCILSGTLHKGSLKEIAEIKNHPWMVGVQFHPEFKSKPLDCHPLFYDFLSAVIRNKGKK